MFYSLLLSTKIISNNNNSNSKISSKNNNNNDDDDNDNSNDDDDDNNNDDDDGDFDDYEDDDDDCDDDNDVDDDDEMVLSCSLHIPILCRVYHKVRVVDTVCETTLQHVLHFDVKKLKAVKWQYTKRLSYGSLLCLSMDDFQSYHFAVVANRDPKDLAKGYLQVCAFVLVVL